jgi:uncharacterized membrane protein
MDTLPLHPKLVHIPMALAVLMPLLSGGLLLAWLRGWFPKRTWLIAVVLQGILLGSAVWAKESGEDEEERVEAVVPESAIEEHEEAADLFLIGAAVVTLTTAAALVVPGQAVAGILGGIATAGTVVVLFLGVRVGEAGGKLVYQHNAGTAYGASAPSPGSGGPVGGAGGREQGEQERE